MIMTKEDLYFYNQGMLYDAYRIFGAHLRKDDNDKVLGTEFTVWAPHAHEVSVLGEFNGFQAWVHNLTKIDPSGIWNLFVEDAKEWHEYKYEIKTNDQRILYKADPYAFFSAERPKQMSKIYDLDGYSWNDSKYMKHRHKQKSYNSQMSIYELHLGTWMNKPDGTSHKYNELVDHLIPYLKDNGFSHVELMPVTEHPLDQSWGYQGTGYYSATSRYGVPKDLMYLVDQCHQNDIKVILDWVPGHICRDDHGLYMFDGEPLYEYKEEWKRENVVWGTANFDLGKGEVQSFLISNALYWMKKFHVDGFRIDAVSNIIYYLGDSRHGVNEGALKFLRDLSTQVFAEFDQALLIAEDSKTAQRHLIQIFNNSKIDMKIFDNGKKLIDYIFSMPEQSIIPAIITDIEMPEMSGFTVIQTLKKDPRTQNIPIIVNSSMTGNNNKREAEVLGANGFIDKTKSHNVIPLIIEVMNKI